jgi:hypothetical protein
MFLIQKEIFSIKECDEILQYLKKDLVNWKSTSRKYTSEIIETNKNTEWIFLKLKTFFEENTVYKIVENKNIIHYHRYVEHDWFGKHNDSLFNRIFGVGVLLNDSFEGGDFIFYNDTTETIKKNTGCCYIFDVNIEHEILPVLNGERHSLLWFLEDKNINRNNFKKTTLI